MVSTSGVASTAKAIKAEFSEKNVTFLAGSIAYNAFVSLVPLLLFLVLALALFGANWQNEVLGLITRNVSPVVGNYLEQIFQSRASGAAGSSLVGVVVLVWGALKLFRGLDTAFSEIYEANAENTIVDQIKDGLVVLVSLVVAIAATIVATSVFGVLQDVIPFIGLLLPLVLAAGLVAAFFPMYYLFPDVDVSPREVLPGVVFAALGWAVLQGLFQVYVSVSTGGGETSVVTGIILLLTWLYFSGVVLLLGAVINAVTGGHAGEDGASETEPASTPDREERLDRNQAADYLGRLREEFGHYDGMEPSTDGMADDARPSGPVQLVERVENGDDGRNWEVTLRWQSED
ncbi:YihY/virulence factor BrkB family protein [Halomicrococcus sp. NG-SE-24]|uniref:YihY/virulence factor BrkB family protein n=1 Tax=Halomicrococcus sp. NG-SE-24 TaxID=3436928 RepID=UPI003D98FA0B